MADIGFACGSCGQNLEAPEEMAGTDVECPSCGATITVPEPAPAQNPADIIQQARSEEPSHPEAESEPAAAPAQTNACPNCQAVMEPDAVLCVQCGFHKGLGKKISTELS